MKRKELIQLIVAVVIVVAAAYVIFLQVAPKGQPQELTYEKITPINPEFDEGALSSLTDASRAKDFYSPPDLKSGIGNPQPFSPLR